MPSNHIITALICIATIIGLWLFFITMPISFALTIFYFLEMFNYIKIHHPRLLEEFKSKRILGLSIEYFPVYWPFEEYKGFNTNNFIRFAFSKKVLNDKKLEAMRYYFRVFSVTYIVLMALLTITGTTIIIICFQ